MYGSRSRGEKSSDLPQKALFGDEYDVRRLVNIIRRYHELRSAAEITIAVYEPVGGGGGIGAKTIFCVYLPTLIRD